ncbi:hypothetical protein [Asticcacaulis biprosthecium]|uniref:hypothetical protein n=1 Tax=Asticcacaulis biprosthecium TaxID=76891 RepID=UPI000305099D|nr:hypothetical protein [Asticcacaulis biprosthecium]
MAWIVDPPMVVEKPIANGRIQISLHGLHERRMRKYMQTGRVTDLGGERCIDLGRVDWADADHNGDVLFASGGCLYRMPQPFAGTDPSSPRCIADLNDLSFEARIAPDHAVQWPQTN